MRRYCSLVGNVLNFPFYPFLIGFIPIVNFYLANFQTLEFKDGLRASALVIILSGCILYFGQLIFKSKRTSSIVVAPLLLVLYLGSSFGMAISIFLLLISLLLAIFFLSGKRFDFDVSMALNLAVLVFLLVPLARVIKTEFTDHPPTLKPSFYAPILTKNEPLNDDLPDIYYIIVDGFGQPNNLVQNFDIPKSALVSGLADLGFQTMSESKANYAQTALSLASTLNFNYLQNLLDIPDPLNGDRRILRRMIGDSRVVRELSMAGYDIVSVPSGYPVTELKNADYVFEPRMRLSFLEYYLLEYGVSSLLHQMLGRGPSDLSYEIRRHRLEYIFDTLPRIKEKTRSMKPTFTFIHLLAPHPPFVFGENGERLASKAKFGYADGSHWLASHGESGPVEYRKLYRGQAIYVMSRLVEAIGQLLKNSDRPPIIIVQGDHGPGSRLNWDDMREVDWGERFGIYNAWYYPEEYRPQWDDHENSVDTFSALFNAVFETPLRPIGGTYWYSNTDRPYAFVEVLR